MENWRGYLNEDPTQITTIGQLHDYFKSIEPGKLKRIAGKYGGIVAKHIGGTVAGVAGTAIAGIGGGLVAGKAASMLAEKAVESLLSAAIVAFANIQDGTYPEGSAAHYFDLDDNLTLFMRELEQKKAGSEKPSTPELEVYQHMIKKVEEKISGGISRDKTIAEVLQDITSKSTMDQKLQSGELGGKVKIIPVGD
jgi:hypothetical protein